MGILVNSSGCRLECDYFDGHTKCRVESKTQHTQGEAIKQAENMGWRYFQDGRCRCPEHACAH